MTNAWTKVNKPTNPSVITSIMVQATAAQPFGLLMALTSVTASGVPTTSIVGTSVIGWTTIAKPTTQAWVKVSKPTS